MMMKKIIHRGIGLLIGTTLLAAASACSAVNEKESSKAASAQSKTPYRAEQENSSTESQEDSESETAASFQAHSITTNELEKFSYWLYIPQNPTENMPLIVYLHGASGRGEDLNLVVSDEDFPKYLQSGELGDVRAYVLIPQLPAGLRGWSNISESLYSLIQKTISDCSIDENNISLAGFSMGGTATWEFAVQYPGLFARIAPLSGRARSVMDQASLLQEVSVWAFVGSDDTVIEPDSSKQMIAELRKNGAAADITVFDGADHISVPLRTYHDENIHLVDWLIGNAG